jgi:hypothetical protein
MHTSTILFGLSALALGGSTIVASARLRLPGDHSGYEPEQPIAFSHRLHAGDLALDCRFCHAAAEHSRHAGVPSASVCMKCHALVTDGFDRVLEERARAEAAGEEPRRTISPELAKLYDYQGLGDDIEPDAGRAPRAIPWQRVHQVPDFVHFDHSVHVAGGVACETCHGPVQSMERVRQEHSLSMGWCVACHRASGATPTCVAPDPEARPHASTDCVTCHL